MLDTLATRPQQPAVVARTGQDDTQAYLRITGGATVWVADPAAASTFASMREAARMALRLPSGLRAFGLPREPAVSAH